MKTLLSVIEEAVSTYPTRPVFRIPKFYEGTEIVQEWATITYAQFHSDIELYARHWANILLADSVSPGSVVGVW